MVAFDGVNHPGALDSVYRVKAVAVHERAVTVQRVVEGDTDGF